jgi:hypothetical protein
VYSKAAGKMKRYIRAGAAHIDHEFEQRARSTHTSRSRTLFSASFSSQTNVTMSLSFSARHVRTAKLDFVRPETERGEGKETSFGEESPPQSCHRLGLGL